jgi:hypothetical protein
MTAAATPRRCAMLRVDDSPPDSPFAVLHDPQVNLPQDEVALLAAADELQRLVAKARPERLAVVIAGSRPQMTQISADFLDRIPCFRQLCTAIDAPMMA